jgi:hypothetical protein
MNTHANAEAQFAAAPSPTLGLPEASIGKLFRRLIPFLFALNVVTYLDRINVVLPHFKCRLSSV